MKVIAFAGSNSSTSRNKLLLEYTLGMVTSHEVTLIDLRDYSLPIYSLDLELAGVWPDNALRLKEMFEDHEAFIIACPEHNGMMPAVFKNLVDWLSRMYKPIFGDKPVFLLSTSTGSKGGSSNLEHLYQIMPRWGARIEVLFSLPDFEINFDYENGVIKNKELDLQLQSAIQRFQYQLTLLQSDTVK